MPTSTHNWFVSAQAGFGGDGSRTRPFHDPWLALRSAAPGDVICLAAGTYFGRYDRGSWIIDCPDLNIRGGYNPDFSRRTPWQTPSIFAAYSEYEAVREINMLDGRGDHSGLVLDGLFFDAAGRNGYDRKPGEGIRSFPSIGAIASFNAKRVAIFNCVFANSGGGGVELSGDGSRFENNLLINILGLAMLNLRSASDGENRLVTVLNNSFCFAHDSNSPPLGMGADNANGVRANCPATIGNNVFVGCGNAAVSLYCDPARVRLDNNLFFLTPHDILTAAAQGVKADITEKNLDELEDVGLKSATGNLVQDPGLTGVRPEWLDTYSRHLLHNYAKPPLAASQSIRKSAGLPAITPTELQTQSDKGDLAPRLTPTDALAVAFTTKQGSHSFKLPNEIEERPVSGTPTYQPINWRLISNPDASLANQSVELRAGLGLEQNTRLLADADPATHLSVLAFEPSSDEESIYVLIRRHTLASRQYEEAILYNRGREVESTYLLRGSYRIDLAPGSRQKITLVVESIAPASLLVKDFPPRPEGRDWFVKAGAGGGDGTRERPFRDPFQALDKAEGGDAIHVTGGDYFGKLHSGHWKLAVRNLALLGGYDAEFTTRNPWTTPTRLLLSEDEKAKGTRDGTILKSEEVSDGLILDGFLFDGATYNTYDSKGSLDLAASPLDPLVSLGGGRAPIQVRNCIFINAAYAGINISCPFGTFENNIVVNTSGWSLQLRAEGPGPWIIRRNTFLFAADPTDRAGTGKSSSEGTLLLLSGRAVANVDANVFAFADNFGVRTSVPSQHVAFTNNVFAANLFNHLTDEKYLWADSSNWERRAVADSGFAACSGNTLQLPRLPLDPAFADAVFPRLFSLPSRIPPDQWKVFAAQAGASAPLPVAQVAAAVEAPRAVASPQSSLSGLLASLSSLKGKTKEQDTRKAAEESAPKYCPLFGWKKALDLAPERADSEPGARSLKLTVSFAGPRAQAAVHYTKLMPEQIDTGLALLDNQAVELEVSQFRDSSRDPSYFPAGTSNNDYYALLVAMAASATRTRIAIVVARDTGVSKQLSRISPTDTLRIRGTARLVSDHTALSIIVDSAELVER